MIFVQTRPLILSFIMISNNNVDLNLIKSLDLILGLELIPNLDNIWFFLAFHVSDICPLLDKYEKHEMLRKISICPKQEKYQ